MSTKILCVRSASSGCEEAAGADGIDVLLIRLIRLWDLGNDIGYPIIGDFSPELQNASTRIFKAA